MSKMSAVTRSLCTFEDIRNQEHAVSGSMLFTHLSDFSLLRVCKCSSVCFCVFALISVWVHYGKMSLSALIF